MLQSPAAKSGRIPEQVLEHADLDDGSATRWHQTRPDQPRPREADRQLSLAVAYDLWLSSWETALSALATATRSRTLSTNEAAAHKAVITTERELVTKQFTLLLGQQVNCRGPGTIFVADQEQGRQRAITAIDGGEPCKLDPECPS